MDFNFGGGMPAMNFMPDWLRELMQGGGATGGADAQHPAMPPMFMNPSTSGSLSQNGSSGQLPEPTFGAGNTPTQGIAEDPLRDSLRKQLIMQAIMQQQKQQPQQGMTLPPVATQMPMGGGGMPNRFAGSAPAMPGAMPMTTRRRFLGQ